MGAGGLRGGRFAGVHIRMCLWHQRTNTRQGVRASALRGVVVIVPGSGLNDQMFYYSCAPRCRQSNSQRRKVARYCNESGTSHVARRTSRASVTTTWCEGLPPTPDSQQSAAKEERDPSSVGEGSEARPSFRGRSEAPKNAKCEVKVQSTSYFFFDSSKTPLLPKIRRGRETAFRHYDDDRRGPAALP